MRPNAFEISHQDPRGEYGFIFALVLRTPNDPPPSLVQGLCRHISLHFADCAGCCENSATNRVSFPVGTISATKPKAITPRCRSKNCAVCHNRYKEVYKVQNRCKIAHVEMNRGPLRMSERCAHGSRVVPAVCRGGQKTFHRRSPAVACLRSSARRSRPGYFSESSSQRNRSDNDHRKCSVPNTNTALRGERMFHRKALHLEQCEDLDKKKLPGLTNSALVKLARR